MVAGALAALVMFTGAVGVGGSGGVPAASAMMPAEDPAAEPLTDAGIDQTEPAAALVIAPLDAVLSDDDAEYRFTVSLRNEAEAAVPAGSLRVSLDPQPLGTVAELASGARDTASASVRIAQLSVAETPGGGEQNLTVTVRRDELPLAATDASGVYLVRAELRLTQTEPLDAWADPLLVSESAPFVWQGFGEIGQVPVTLLVPLVLPESVRVMPSRAQIEQVVPRFARLIDAAEAYDGVLAVDPRIVAGIRSLGDDAPASAAAFLEQLESTTAQLIALQFADADPAAQSALGFTQLLAPVGFTFATNEGTFSVSSGDDASEAENETDDDAGSGDTDTAAEDDPASEATDSAENADAGPDDAGDPSGEPSLAELLALPRSAATAWPAAGAVDSATLELLAASGITSVVLDSGNVIDATASRVRIGDFTALIADGALTSATRAALDETSITHQASGVASLTARLALTAQQGSDGIVLAVDRGAIAEAADPARLVDTLAALDWVGTVSESAQPEGTGALRAGETAEERRELLRGTVSRSAQIDALAPLLAQPAHLTEYQRVRLLEAFATRYAEPDVDFAEIDEATRVRDAELLRGVEIVPTENTQLVGTSSRVPITLHNLLPFDAEVSVRVTPLSAGISVPERSYDAQQVPAGSNQVVLVTVDSRVSSGESGMRIEVWDRAGEQAFAERTLRLTLRSSYETIMLVALGATATLLLGFGIWRSVRRRAHSARE